MKKLMKYLDRIFINNNFCPKTIKTSKILLKNLIIQKILFFGAFKSLSTWHWNWKDISKDFNYLTPANSFKNDYSPKPMYGDGTNKFIIC